MRISAGAQRRAHRLHGLRRWAFLGPGRSTVCRVPERRHMWRRKQSRRLGIKARPLAPKRQISNRFGVCIWRYVLPRSFYRRLRGRRRTILRVWVSRASLLGMRLARCQEQIFQRMDEGRLLPVRVKQRAPFDGFVWGVRPLLLGRVHDLRRYQDQTRQATRSLPASQAVI